MITYELVLKLTIRYSTEDGGRVRSRGPVLLSKWLDRFDAKDGVFRKVAAAQCQSKSLSKTRMKPDRRLRKSRFHVNLVECIIYAAPVETASVATRLATK